MNEFQSKVGKISVIPKDMSGAPDSPEKSLRQKGYSRSPGTGLYMLPHRDTDMTYRTGLDPNAFYIQNIPVTELREAEKKRVTALRDYLQKATNLDLSPNSRYYAELLPIKLKDGDNLFPYSNTNALITYAWLSVHPGIAPSLNAWHKGDVSSDTVYYVNDEDIEEAVKYKRNRIFSDAVGNLNTISLEKRRKIGALLNLPISASTKEEPAFNLLYTMLQKDEFTDGPYKGKQPAEIFNMFVNIDPEVLDVRSLVDTALKNQIYRIKFDAVWEGEQQIFNNKEELIQFLLMPKNQNERLSLEKKLESKQVALV